MRALKATVLLLLLTACVDDPVGVGVLNVAVEGNVDTTWVGTPGEPMPGAVRLHVTDDEGRPLAAASITWEAVGRNALVLRAMEQTDARGVAEAGWQLGTDAVEDQQMAVTVRAAHKESHLVIHARAVPYIVSRVRVVVDTPAVLRLGDTLPVRAIAIDPYGNEFAAPEPVLSVADSGVASALAGAVVGSRRGQTTIYAISHGVSAVFSLHVTQYVAAILPVTDILQFSALGAELPVAYEVRDDRGRVVADTTVAIEAANSAVVQVVGGNARAVAPGVTSLRLSLGPASATMLAGVQQRVGSLRLIRDTIRLDALMDTTTVVPVVHDSLGSPIPDASLAYDVSDREVARLANVRTLEALKPGAALLTVRDSATGISTSANVVVQQVVTAVAVNQSQIAFDALGDSASLSATAHDRLGSVVPDVSFQYSVDDTMVVTVDSLNQLHAVGPGQATVSVRDTVTGVVGTSTVRVDQIATGLTAQVTFGSEIITLPTGSPLPLSCSAVDRNGYAIAREPALASVKGTVTGGGCADATVQRSGYDTLVFAMNGVQARVPVIVATRPDSVGIVSAAQPLATDDRIRFVGEDLANPLILALRPLVQDILAAYGNPATNLGRAQAIRDWVARTAVSPDPAVHPNNSTSNLSVLPSGKTWADVNRVLSPEEWDEDRMYWDAHLPAYEGYAILDLLLGTLDPTTGTRADDGLMVHVEGARYRIRDIESYHYTLCTFQAITVLALWKAAGLQGMVATTLDHDPAVVFIPELGSWVYQDPTFSEEYLLDGAGDPLSPLELLTLSTNGQAARLRATKLPGPTYDPQPYNVGWSYRNVHPEGMVIMGSQLYNRAVGQLGWSGRFVQIDVPRLATAPAPLNNPLVYARVAATDAFPMLGVVVDGVRVEDSVYVVQLSSTLPNHEHFERRFEGLNWENVGDVDVLPVGATKVEYRSVDGIGNISASALLDVWAPRTQDFVQSAIPGTRRAQAQYWVSP